MVPAHRCWTHRRATTHSLYETCPTGPDGPHPTWAPEDDTRRVKSTPCTTVPTTTPSYSPASSNAHAAEQSHSPQAQNGWTAHTYSPHSRNPAGTYAAAATCSTPPRHPPEPRSPTPAGTWQAGGAPASGRTANPAGPTPSRDWISAGTTQTRPARRKNRRRDRARPRATPISTSTTRSPVGSSTTGRCPRTRGPSFTPPTTAARPHEVGRAAPHHSPGTHPREGRPTADDTHPQVRADTRPHRAE